MLRSYFQRIEINGTKLEKTPIYFKSDGFAAVTFVDAKSRYWSRAKQRQRNVQKGALHVQISFC